MAVYMGEEEVIQKNMALAQEKVYTVEDIEELPEGVRAELIDGQMFYMATPSRKHQGLVGNLFGEIFAYLNQNKGKCAVYPAPFAVYLNEDNRRLRP